jgi:hypothetical protein
MPRRRRWTPVRGTGSRVYDPVERLAVGVLDLPGRLVAAGARGLGLRPPPPPLDPDAVREALVLRLDRIGDVIMSLPALADLRAALPRARIRLAVGRWGAEAARTAPVDEILVWNAPVGRASGGADRFGDLARRAPLRKEGLDLALDLRATCGGGTPCASPARRRCHLPATPAGLAAHRRVVRRRDAVVGRAEPPGGDRGAGAAAGRPSTSSPRRARVRRRLVADSGPRRAGPGCHSPSGGRAAGRGRSAQTEIALRLQREFRATILLTGSEADRPRPAAVAPAAVPGPSTSPTAWPAGDGGPARGAGPVPVPRHRHHARRLRGRRRR